MRRGPGIDKARDLRYIMLTDQMGVGREFHLKREEKNALARQRILDAAIGEFSRRGYEGASLTAFCAKHGISKGIVYHHFKDKNELYLLCVRSCFDALTERLQLAMDGAEGTPEERMQIFYQAWLHFFAEHPRYLGIFSVASFRTPQTLSREINRCREGYDTLYASAMMMLMEGKRLRAGLPMNFLTEECRIYMDFYNTRFLLNTPGEGGLEAQEIRCRQQMDILLYGVLEPVSSKTEKGKSE